MPLARAAKIIVDLQAEPSFRRSSEICSQPECHISGNRTHAIHSFADAVGRNIQIPSQLVCADPYWERICVGCRPFVYPIRIGSRFQTLLIARGCSMADDGSAQSRTVWPLPKFHCQVKWDGTVMSFQEVSGLEVEAEPIEYRHGDSNEFSVIKMPGIKKTGNVTLKKGVFKSDNKFWDWFKQIKMNTIQRVPVTISLLDEAGAATMVFTLANAWPTKITGTDLKSDGNGVAVESIEIAHEGLTISNG